MTGGSGAFNRDEVGGQVTGRLNGAPLTDEMLLSFGVIRPRWIRFKSGRLFHLVNEARQGDPAYLIAATVCGGSGEQVANVVCGGVPGSRPVCPRCIGITAAAPAASAEEAPDA